MLLMTAWKMLASWATPTKYQKRWMTYHSIPTKLPSTAATTKTKIDKNPPQKSRRAQNPTAMLLKKLQTGSRKKCTNKLICLKPGRAIIQQQKCLILPPMLLMESNTLKNNCEAQMAQKMTLSMIVPGTGGAAGTSSSTIYSTASNFYSSSNYSAQSGASYSDAYSSHFLCNFLIHKGNRILIHNPKNKNVKNSCTSDMTLVIIFSYLWKKVKYDS